jgi:hypothetical protein
MQLQENNGLAIDVRLSRDALHNRADEPPAPRQLSPAFGHALELRLPEREP